MTKLYMDYAGYTAMTVTNLQSLGNDAADPFSAWQSDMVDNRTTKALDYLVQFLLPVAAVAPSGDACVFAYVVPWMHNGTAWVPMANFGTTTRPTGTEGTAIISEPNSMLMPRGFPYKITSQPIDGMLSIAGACGGVCPQGWSVALRDASGAALGTGCIVAHLAIAKTSA